MTMIVESKIFEAAVLICIALSSIALVCEQTILSTCVNTLKLKE